MPYNVYAVRLSNTDKRIKNQQEKRSSLTMAAYIFGHRIQDDLDRNTFGESKKLRDQGEVAFRGMVFPEGMPLKTFSDFVGEDGYQPKTLSSVFVNVPEDAIWKDHYFEDNEGVVARFWDLSDEHIFALEREQNGNNERTKKMRIYQTYVLTLPVANQHFPADLAITRDDLLPICYGVIFELIHEHFLSKGLPVLFGFHTSKGEIDQRVHVHLLVPTRTLKYYYDLNQGNFDHNQMLEWLKRKKIYEAHSSLKNQLNKIQHWQKRFDDDPSEYNLKRLNHFQMKGETTQNLLDGMTEIIAQNRTSGQIYEKLKQDYLRVQNNKLSKDNHSNSIFSSQKGAVENHLDTYNFVDTFKQSYADLLNKHLAQVGILQEGYKLYTTAPTGPSFVTVKDMKNWGLSHAQRERVNKIIKKIFTFDYSFYKKEISLKHLGETVYKKRHLIVHTIKSELKAEFNRRKHELALDVQKAEGWVNDWKKKLDSLSENFAEFLKELVDPAMFNANWRSKIKNKLDLFWQKTYEYNANSYFNILNIEGLELELDDQEREISVNDIIALQPKAIKEDESPIQKFIENAPSRAKRREVVESNSKKTEVEVHKPSAPAIMRDQVQIKLIEVSEDEGLKVHVSNHMGQDVNYRFRTPVVKEVPLIKFYFNPKDDDEVFDFRVKFMKELYRFDAEYEVHILTFDDTDYYFTDIQFEALLEDAFYYKLSLQEMAEYRQQEKGMER